MYMFCGCTVYMTVYWLIFTGPIMSSITVLLVYGIIHLSSATSYYNDCTVHLQDRCIQKCNATACQCQHVYNGCTQMCGQYPCQIITCSSATCIQSCHGCTMECTSAVGFCVQRCLSGQCTFKCSAAKCNQDCSHGDCKQTSNVTSVIPRDYLLALAGCFGATSILSLIALCLSCRAMKPRRKNTYQRLRPVCNASTTDCHAIRHYNQPINILPLLDRPI